MIFLAHYHTLAAASGDFLFSRNRPLGPKMVPKWSPGGTIFLPKWPEPIGPAHFWAPPGTHLGREGAPGRSKRAQRHPKRSNSTTFGMQNGRPRAPNPTKKQDATKPRQDKTRQATTRQDRTRQDKTRQDKTRQKKTRLENTRHDKTEHKTQDNRHNPQPNEKARRNARSG